MIRIIVGIFLILHGLVHLLYFGQSTRFFELQPGMVWPDGSLALAKFSGAATIRSVVGILLILAAIGFIASGTGVFTKLSWWRPVVVGTAAFSSVIYLLSWDGSWGNLNGKGGIGILINLAILATVLIFHWPNL
jgi:hypothetical protein